MLFASVGGLTACMDRNQAPEGSHWTQVNGHRLYYERYGAGRPMVLLHGGGESVRDSLGAVLPFFVAHHEVIAPEQVGHGHTPDIPGPLTYTAMMEDTAALLKQLNVRHADVVGWSDGGNVALILALRHPELVRRVVVSGANFAPEGLNPDEIADTKRQLKRWQASKPDSFDVKLLSMWLAAPTREELSQELLRGIEQPALVMVGDHDAIRFEHTLQLYRAMPHAELCVLPDTGHATFQDRPALTRMIVEHFLESEPQVAVSDP